MLDKEMMDTATHLENLLKKVEENIDLCEEITLYEVQSKIQDMNYFIDGLVGDRPI